MQNLEVKINAHVKNNKILKILGCFLVFKKKKNALMDDE